MTRDSIDLSRRETLLGLSTIGTASIGAGIGSYAAFTDRKRATTTFTAGELDLTVHHETRYNGQMSRIVSSNQLDGEPGRLFELPDIEPGDSGHTRFCFEFETNPAYLWVCGELLANDEHGQSEPEAAVDDTGGDPGDGKGELADAIDVELKYVDLNGSSLGTIASGTLREILVLLSRGIPLDATHRDGVLDPGHQAAFDASPPEGDVVTPCLMLEWSIDRSVGNEIQTDRVKFRLQFHALQARHADGTRNPCDDDGEDEGGGPQQKAISFVAFCVEEGSILESDVEKLEVTKGGREPIGIYWETAKPIDRVVLKTGGGPLAIENFPGGTSGSAIVGYGSARLSTQTASSPCPDGESGVKFEFSERESSAE